MLAVVVYVWKNCFVFHVDDGYDEVAKRKRLDIDRRSEREPLESVWMFLFFSFFFFWKWLLFFFLPLRAFVLH